MKATFIFLFLVLLFSCQSSEEKQLEKVLTLAGNNRPELEKVLEHYKENEADSLKLRAAKFLIMNMPGHQSYIGKDIEEYYVEAEKIIFSDRKIDEQVNELNNLLPIVKSRVYTLYQIVGFYDRVIFLKLKII